MVLERESRLELSSCIENSTFTGIKTEIILVNENREETWNSFEKSVSFLFFIYSYYKIKYHLARQIKFSIIF